MKKKIIIIIITIFIVLAGIMFSPLIFEKNAFFSLTSPFGKFLQTKFTSFYDFLVSIKSIKSLSYENKQLKEKTNELQSEINKLIELGNENETLKKELNIYKQKNNYEKIGAQIISKSVNPYLSNILLDKGQDDGVTKGQIVIAEGYLVGKIKESYSKYSEVELITSPDTILPVVLQKSRITGLLKSDLEGLFIDNIPSDAEVTEGEEVITTNLNQETPADISVGKVKKIISFPSQIFKTVKINSPINFYSLKFVFIIKNNP